MSAAASILSLALLPLATPAARQAEPATPVVAPVAPAATATPKPPGKTYFIVGMWPGQLAKIDPDTDQIVKTVPFRHGVGYDSTLLHDRKHLLQVTGQRAFVEVVDLETMEIVDEHSFERDGFIVRVQDVKEIPGGDRWYVRVEEVEKKLDSFVVKEAEWVEYDVKERKLGKRMKELPRPIRRAAHISPDGTKWHVIDKDLVVVDPKTLEEEGKVELSKPLYAGLGPISIRGEDFYDEKNPDAYRFLYSMRDPVNKSRTLTGLVDIDMRALKVSRLVEWGAALRVGGWEMSRDHRVAVGQARSGERRSQAEGRDPEITLVTLDLETGQKLKETRIEVRNGLHVGGISPDGGKIYLVGRGSEMVVYDKDHKYLKTVELPGDADGTLLSIELE